jgi:hypothetical protein
MSAYRGGFTTPLPCGTRVPGSAAPRTGARVVAFGGLDPFTNPLAAARLPPLDKDASSARSVTNTTFSNEAGVESYIPYVHLPTGCRVLVSAFVDPTTGERRPRAVVHHEFAPVMGNEIAAPHAPLPVLTSDSITSDNFLVKLFCGLCDPTVHRGFDDLPPPAPVPTIDPTRRLDFEGDGDSMTQDEEGREAKRLAVPSDTLKSLRAHGGKLELHDIKDFIIDLKTAIVLADPDSHILVHSERWRDALDAKGIRMNKRIATAIDGALDGGADNVIYLKSILRKAHESTRPGILYSGMDIIEQIEALVTKRTVGEIKLTKDAAKSLVFEAGVDVAKTRLRANEIEQHFALKPAAKRAVPNAIMHEYIKKIPDVGDEGLKLKKERYEDELCTAEMNGESPPWTDDALINGIAVALARAQPRVTRQIAVVDAPHLGRCANCGAVGKHAHKDCPGVCTDGNCGFNFCPGTRGMVCAVKFSIPPSKRNPPLMNALEPPRPILPNLIARLDAAWEAKHKKSVRSQPMEVACVEAAYDDDSD